MDRYNSTGVKNVLFKWARICVFLLVALVLFYIGINFRVVVIPENYTVLHPCILPGQHWVYLRTGSHKKEILEPGNIVMFNFTNNQGRVRRHISMLIGKPGQQVKYISGSRIFRVDSQTVLNGVELSDPWTDTGDTVTDVQKGSFLLIDTNVYPGGRKFWTVDSEQITGKLMFQLPF